MSDQLRNDIINATSFLDYQASISVRVSYILSNLKTQKLCIECNSPIQHTRRVNQASDFCSIKCSRKCDRTKKRRQSTNKKRYGVDNPFNNTVAIKQSVRNKFGVDNVAHLDEVKRKISEKNKQNSAERIDKIKSTNKERYGVDWFSKTQYWQDAVKDTNQKRRGVDWTFFDLTIQDQIRKTNLEKYGVTNPSQHSSVVSKIADTKKQRYGDSRYNNRQAAENTMSILYGRNSSQQHWSEDTYDLMNNSDLLQEFVVKKTINDAAEQLGVAPTTLRNKLKDFDIEFYIKRKNQFETFVQDILDQHQIKYQKNNRTLIAPKEIDFYIPDYNLAIEVNGIFWHSELMGKDRNYHVNKMVVCSNSGIRLIHIWDFQIEQHPEIISSMITHVLNATQTKVYARQTRLVEINSATYGKFLLDNHLQGKINSSIKLGLEFQGNLVGVIGAGKSRFNQDEYELHRLAFLRNHSIIGGASKLFSHLIKAIPTDTIVSYADRDFSTGNVYTQLGFRKIGISGPSYYYFKNRKVESRIKYQKHKLERLLDNYDSNLTEWENMKNHGYNRFWTTGNIKYEYRKN